MLGLRMVKKTVNFDGPGRADLTEKIYINMGHTIIQDELGQANKLVFKKSLGTIIESNT
jgi:hypothetical protein